MSDTSLAEASIGPTGQMSHHPRGDGVGSAVNGQTRPIAVFPIVAKTLYGAPGFVIGDAD